MVCFCSASECTYVVIEEDMEWLRRIAILELTSPLVVAIYYVSERMN